VREPAYFSDGTSAGTRRLGKGDLAIRSSVSAGGKLYFSAGSSGAKQGLWEWDDDALGSPRRV
jgi:hypothetical protein